MQTEHLIIGGGLSGLYLAYRLSQQGKDFLLLEARDRLGGRIESQETHDLGPTWFWPGQRLMAQLTEELGLKVFEQQNQGDILYEDPTVQGERIAGHAYQMTSYRIEAGIGRLIEALNSQLPENKVLRNHKVTSIKQQEDMLTVLASTSSQASTFYSRQVYLGLPPRLIQGTINFEPSLESSQLKDMREIPTWMAGHAKALIRFERPFWRETGLSGQAFSRLGPLMELHDASNGEGNFALFGFIGGSGKQRIDIGEEQLIKLVYEQISRLYGPTAPRPLEIIIKDWSQDKYTATEDDLEPLQQHPNYSLPASLNNIWRGQIKLIGTEVAPSEGGYLEGALTSAEKALK